MHPLERVLDDILRRAPIAGEHDSEPDPIEVMRPEQRGVMSARPVPLMYWRGRSGCWVSCRRSGWGLALIPDGIRLAVAWPVCCVPLFLADWCEVLAWRMA